MKTKKFWDIVNKYGWSVETDNSGQIVLYTGLMFDSENDNIVKFVDQEEIQTNE
jgi:hypothetical protein